MKRIDQQEIDNVKSELLEIRKKFDKIDFPDLNIKLQWIGDFFSEYITKLEKKYLTEREIENGVILPNAMRLQFYLIFPEHGLNMGNSYEKLRNILLDEGRGDILPDCLYTHRD